MTAPKHLAATSATQVQRPWRTTARSVFQFVIALAVLLPVIVGQLGVDVGSLPWLGVILAVAGAIVRIMALPQVETFLRRWAPWLAAEPRQ